MAATSCDRQVTTGGPGCRVHPSINLVPRGAPALPRGAIVAFAVAAQSSTAPIPGSGRALRRTAAVEKLRQTNHPDPNDIVIPI